MEQRSADRAELEAENARLQERVRELERAAQAGVELNTAVRRLEMLARMSAGTVGHATVSETGRRLAQDIAETFDVDACVIRAIEGDELRLVAAAGVPEAVLAERIPIYGLAERILQMRAPIVIADVHTHDLTKEIAEKGRSVFDFTSYAGVPLMTANEPIGVLGIYSKRPHEFNAMDTEHLGIVGNHVAVTLRNEMLYRTVQAQQRELAQWTTELERQVEERTRELRDTVADLEGFTYSISHDLRSPIRAMVGYATLIEEEHGKDLGPNGLRYVKSIRSSAIRLGRLVDDLLAFSRLGRRVLHYRTVQPREIVESVLAEESPTMAGRDIQIEIGELPPCHADPSLLRTVYQNLISNAIKFTRPRSVARVEIGSTQEHGQTAYFVRDNGIGFDARYADRVFGVFQRLHADDRFEGTGVGLALVQRIVNRHGGQVWATSQPDKGATFYFTLGARADRSDD